MLRNVCQKAIFPFLHILIKSLLQQNRKKLHYIYIYMSSQGYFETKSSNRS